MPKWFVRLRHEMKSRVPGQEIGVIDAPTRTAAIEEGVKKRPYGLSEGQARRRMSATGYGTKDEQK